MNEQAISPSEPDTNVLQQVSDALDRALERVEKSENQYQHRTFEVSSGRYIIFSDLHRGGRDDADDFKCCEGAYNAALSYYFRMGHTLILLGDIEELWEERPETVLTSYSHIYGLEARFHWENRCIRVWGNHDDNWRYEGQVKKHLQPLYGDQPLTVPEGFRLCVVGKSGEPSGRLFFIHGHQGDWKSDNWAWLSKPVVRYLWRPFQRRFHVSLNTPAKDWKLRDQYNIAMARWAEQKPGVVLIAGHTHQPVFESRPQEAQIREWVFDSQLLEEQPAETCSPQQIEALNAAKQVWDEIEIQRAREAPAIQMNKLCYFNTGCGCYYDGHITGIEIIDGDIQLVRWPDNMDKPKPQILAKQSLCEVLQTR